MPIVRRPPGTCAAAFNRLRGLDIRGCDPDAKGSGPISRMRGNLASRDRQTRRAEIA
jgi:hypothetical protein